MTDRIRIEGIEFHGYHGVSAEEQAIGHRYRVDAELELDLRPAAATDDVELTVDYGAAAATLVEVGTDGSVHLVETLAQRMADRLLTDYPRITALQLDVAKIQPPCPVHFQAAIIRIRRER